MNNNSNERMINIVIGEAVMQLVDEGADISWRAVTETLRCQLNLEQDSERLMVLRHAITQVQDELRSHSTSHNLFADRPAAERILH